MLGGMPSYCLLYVKLIRNQIFYILKLNAHFTRHILTALSSIRYLQGCKKKKLENVREVLQITKKTDDIFFQYNSAVISANKVFNLHTLNECLRYSVHVLRHRVP